MYNQTKIGLGILTFNRPALFSRLLQQVQQLPDLDEIRIVKNKLIDYGKADPIAAYPSISTLVAGDVGISKCKNMLLKQLLDAGCKHIFILEDDVNIKNTDVLNLYIRTAEEFNIHHLNFCYTYDQATTQHSIIKPFISLKHGKYAIDIYRRLSGVFEYFTSYALQTVGFMNEKYINALEHCEHTYRMSIAGLTTPFYAFADVHDSYKYIEDDGIRTTIVKDAEYVKRLKNSAMLFKQTYNCWLSQLPIPTSQQIVDALDKMQDEKARR